MLPRALLLGLLLCLSSIGLLAQDGPEQPDGEPKPGESSFALPGSDEPLKIKARYADTSREAGGISVFLASGSVFAWQGDERAPGLKLTCESLVVWRTPTDKTDAQGNPVLRTELYAEGNVRFERGREVLFGNRMFFDLENNKGLVDRARYATRLKQGERLVPLVIRARRFRLLDGQRSIAQDAFFTTSSFGDPGYRFQASNILITSNIAEGKLNTLHSRSVLRIREPSGRNDIPFMFFPYLALSAEDDFPLKKIEVGNDGRFGFFAFTEWGQKIGTWGSWLLDLDYSVDRGIGVGPGVEYDALDKAGNEYRGTIRTYFIRDRLEGSGEEEETGQEVPQSNRYRFRWQHRHQLDSVSPKLTLDLEVSKISDRGFLREFFEEELREEKQQETIAFLRKQHDNHQASVLFKTELNDFITATEYYPQLRLDTVAEPLVDGSRIFRNLYLTSSNQIAYLRRQVDSARQEQVVLDEETGEETVEQIETDDGETQFRGDFDQRLNYPIRLGEWGINPFIGVRPGFFSASEGRNARLVGSAGIRVDTQYSRLYRVHVPGLDISNVQHVITPEIRYTNIFAADPEPDDLIFFDEVDTVGQLQIITLKLLNRFKTRRFKHPRHDAVRFPGPRRPYREPVEFDRRQRQGDVVEFVYWSMQLPIYPNASRDNFGSTLGDLDVEFDWEILRWWRLDIDSEIRLGSRDGRRQVRREDDDLEDTVDVNEEDLADSEDDNAGIRTFNISTTIQSRHRDYARWTATVGNRYARNVSNTLFISGTLAINPKWELGAFLDYETEDSRIGESKLTLRRYFDRVVFELSAEREEGDQRGDNETSVRFALIFRAMLDDDDNEEQYDDEEEDEDDSDQPPIFEQLGGGAKPDPADGEAPVDPR